MTLHSPRRARRTGRLAARSFAVAALGAAVLAAPAGAYSGPGSVDTNPANGTPSLVYPGTTTPTDAWKLIGGGRGANYTTATEVQISPRWVIAAHHSRIQPGDNFVTQSGDSVPVLETYSPDQLPADTTDFTGSSDDGGADIALMYLSRPVAPPPGGFPRLLSDHVGPDLDSSLPGYVLSAGLGGQTNYPSPVVGWTKPNGLNVPGGKRVWVVGGDSGSVGFWYPSAGARPVISSVRTTGRVGALGFGLDSNFAEPLQPGGANNYATLGDFMRATFAKHPQSQTGVADPEWTTLAALGINPTTLAPPAPRGISLSADSTSDLTVNWNPGSGSPVPVTGYRVTLSPGGQSQTVAGTTNFATFTGVSAGVAYTATVTAFNANGDEHPAGALGAFGIVPSTTTDPSDAPITEPSSATGTIGTPPSALGSPRIDAIGPQLGAVPPVQFQYCATVSWAAATTASGQPITSYSAYRNGDLQLTNVTGSAQTRFSTQICGLQPGNISDLFIWANDGIMTGPPALLMLKVPSGPPAGTPLALTGLTASTQRVVSSSGAVDYCSTISWDALPAVSGYSAGSRYFTTDDTNGDYSAAWTPWSSNKPIVQCGLQPGDTYDFLVAVGYLGLAGSVDGHVTTTVPAGPPAGTVLPPVTGVTLTPTKTTTSTGTNECVTVAWNAPVAVGGLLPTTIELDFVTGNQAVISLSWPEGSAPTSHQFCGLPAGKLAVASVTSTYQVNATATYDTYAGATTHTLT